MNFFDLMALAVIGWIIIEVIKAIKGKSSDSVSATTAELFDCEWNDNKKVKALNKEVAALKERIANLEAIVTDEKYQLNKEIDKL